MDESVLSDSMYGRGCVLRDSMYGWGCVLSDSMYGRGCHPLKLEKNHTQ